MNRKRVLLLAVTVLALVAAWLNALVVRFWTVDFQLFGEVARRGDYLTTAGAHLATMLILSLGLAALFVFGTPWWLKVLAAVGIGSQLALGLVARARAAELDPDPLGTTTLDGILAAFYVPGSWPLLALILASVIIAVRRSGRDAAQR